MVEVDPPTPTLEQLWEGKVDIAIRGLNGRSIKCRVSLFEGMDTGPTVDYTLPSLRLPVEPVAWRTHFATHFRKFKKAQDKYDTARACRLEFSADELGAFTIECERDFVPLRWAVRQRGSDSVARLIDDSGTTDPPEVSRFTFDRPAVAVQLPHSPEYVICPPGGLYVARREDFATAVIGAPRTIRDLVNLGGTPEIEGRERTVDAVLGAVESAAVWGSARSSGDILSLYKRGTVLQALSGHILLLVGGERWARAEQAVAGGGDRDLSGLKRAVSDRRDQAGIAAALALEMAHLASAEPQARVARLAELAVSFRLLESGESDEAIQNPIWLAEFALRLASSPKDADAWAGTLLRSAVVRLMEGPVLARAARFMVIAMDRHLQSRVGPGELYAGWRWP